MSVALAKANASADAMAPHDATMIERALIQGDLSRLSSEERTKYYMRVCETVGLNPMTSPFEYLNLNGKLRLYATKNCTDQLRSIHRVSVSIVAREKVDDVYVVTARAMTPDGRMDESTGVVTLGNARGDNLCNAMMKAETKAKRRVTLSICGLSMLDETEVETVPGAQAQPNELTATAVARLPEVSARTEELARQRNEDAALVDEWMGDLKAIVDAKNARGLDAWIAHNWPTAEHMEPRSRGKVYRALVKAGGIVGASEAEVQRATKAAARAAAERDDEPPEGELIEDDEPLLAPDEDVEHAGAVMPVEAQTIVESFSKVHVGKHWRAAWNKHRDAIAALASPWKGYVRGVVREAGLRANIDEADLPRAGE